MQTRPVIDRLPAIRGRYTEGALLSKVTWFQVGGPADVMYKPADLEDLQTFLAGKPKDIPVFTLGVGSNILVRDGGFPGVVIRLGAAFATIEIDDDRVIAGAAALDLNVAKAAAKAGRSGLEFYSGIPGTIGGALRMNAGAYGSETRDVLISATSVAPSGDLVTHTPETMDMRYRHCGVPADHIFVGAVFRTAEGDRDAIEKRMQEIREARTGSQPIRSRTGGSTFKNPEGMKAWQLIDAVGCRGLTRGGAQVSDQHCNFLINTGTATAADLEGLGEEVRTRVKDRLNVSLEWEIKRIGEAS
ncbi:MAG: UDP-N-acetylmuramate dehydrogenase [Alphaproteobacteria bacterium]